MNKRDFLILSLVIIIFLLLFLSNNTIQKNSYVYEEIELEPKKKKKIKEFKNPFINWKLDL